MTEVDVILPCYQPPSQWHEGLIVLNHYLKSNYKLHFIIVLDGTPKAHIQDALNHLHINAISNTCIELCKNYGKGYAIREGVKHAQASYIVYTDIDIPFTLKSFDLILQHLVTHQADVIAGVRDTAYYQNRMSASRRMLSKAFRVFIKTCIRMPISDTQCGIKGFKSNAKPLFLQTQINRYLFDFEWIYRLSRQHQLQLKSVVVELKQGIRFRQMPMWVLVQEFCNLIYILITTKQNP
jgi:glycosyltransferase involved in cell wall biosynthesis